MARCHLLLGEKEKGVRDAKESHRPLPTEMLLEEFHDQLHYMFVESSNDGSSRASLCGLS